MDFRYLHDDELERIVLGCIITNKDCAVSGLYTLKIDDFYIENFENREIFKSLVEIVNDKKEIDINSLKTKLIQNKTLDKIGLEYISDIITSSFIYSNFDQYVESLKEYNLMRKLVLKCNEIIDRATKKEVESIGSFLGQAEREIVDVTTLRKITGFEKAKNLAERVGGLIQKIKGNKVLGDNLTTGFSNLDTAISGFGKGQLIVIAARPGVGKSALALNMCYKIATQTKKTIAYFSLEMSNEELMKRLFSISSGVSQDKINKGFLSMQDKALIKEAEEKIASTNMYFEESTTLSIDDILLKSTKLKEERDDLSLIVVDHIGIIQEGNRKFNSDQEKIQLFSRKLKQMALELDVPVIVVCHINREGEKGERRKPELSQLRGSGAIENDCDKALLLYSEDYYKKQGISLKGKSNEEGDDVKDNLNRTKGELMTISISKNRQGPLGKITLLFFPYNGKFDVPSDENEFDSIENPFE